jgi:putative nucleotidyltransferase with HDIG domain
MLPKIPLPVKDIIESLNKAGFEAFAVGGCVRDTLIGRAPKDWDVTTDAVPEKVVELFPESFYENDFGTVGVKVPRFLASTPEDKEHDIIEVTTYRIESDYTDKRRPKEVLFTQSLEEDLARRDFTVNAIAYGPRNDEWGYIDPFDGRKDLEKKIIRTVGNPEERFGEDALRLMRAVRFYAELRDPKETRATHSWHIEEKTLAAIKTLAGNLEAISKERVRDELSKIILSDSPSEGIQMLEDTGLLRFIMPELREGIDVSQNLHHIYTVWEHNLKALATCPSNKLSVRLAALLHDVGKPRTKKGDGYRSTFYNHDHVGARMVRAMLTRLRFSRAVIDHAALLVDNHLFYYNVGEVTEASVRRLIRRVGLENMRDLMDVRIGDRLGSGVPKAKPYKLRHLEYMVDKVSQDPISAKMLKVNGTDLIGTLGMPAGPAIGAILDVLLAEVIEDPTKNDRDALLTRAGELRGHDLAKLRDLAKERIEEKREEDDQKIKKTHWVE